MNRWRQTYYLSVFLCLFFTTIPFSCKEGNNPVIRSHQLAVNEAKGIVAPQDSIVQPIAIPVNESKIKKVEAGKPTSNPTNTNIHIAGLPKVIASGTPRVVTPGSDTFSLPTSVSAINSPFIAGISNVVLAKDMVNKDQNPSNFSFFGTLQGLNSGFITSLLEDRKGNLWFGTYNGGLCKYDGKYFTHLTGKEGLNDDTVYSIFEDKNENIWFGTQGGGVYKYDGKSFTHFDERHGFLNNIVRSIAEDKTGNMWFGTIGGGVCKYDGKSFTHFTIKEGLVNNNVYAIIEDKNGNLWFGTYGGGVSKYDGKSFSNFGVKEGLPDLGVTSLMEDRNGNVWFGTYGGLSKFDGKFFTNFTVKEGLSNNIILSLLQDNKGNIWFGTNGSGVCKFDGTSFTYLGEQEGLSNNVVRAALEDRSGNLWFGTFGGVSKYNGNSFSQFSEKEGFNSNGVFSVLEDKNHDLWVGTNNGGLYKYDGKTFTHFTTKEGLNSNIIISLLEDSSDNIWFGTATGVSKYDGTFFTHFNESVNNNMVVSLAEDKRGNLWFGTEGNGVYKYDGASISHFTKKEGLLDNTVYSILEDKKGNIWFAMTGGVCKYDGNRVETIEKGENSNAQDQQDLIKVKGKFVKSFTHFNTGISTAISMLEDKNGLLWFGTLDQGICKYDGTSYTYFTEKEGLSSNLVLSLLNDKMGNLWFGSPSGLSKLTPAMHALLSGKAQTSGITESNVFFKNYSYEDGFMGILGYHKTMIQSSDGTIWVGTNDRLIAFHPEGELKDTIPPNIQLTSIELFNETIDWASLEQKKDSSIVLGNGIKIRNYTFDGLSKWNNLPEHLSLAYNNNFLTINFIGITQLQSRKVKYQYKLEGLDENWSAVSSRTSAPYGNLPDGLYTFKVKAMNSEGYWSKELDYTFVIRPPWWKTWWMYALYALSIMVALRFFVLRRERGMLKETERLETKVLARTNELKAEKEKVEKTLVELKSTQSQLIHSEKMASLGELTAGIAHEIQNPLNFVNNFSDVNIELIEEMKTELQTGNIEEAIAIANDITDNEKKINHHGKRADAIVKGMLQHSRTNSGGKEPTDINALCDEYLRLAYHGLRAKDKSFNAIMKTDFDPSIGKINVIPQDIGRVLLNLITNAFYAVSTPNPLQGSPPLPPMGGKNYEPTIMITTKKMVPPLGGKGGKQESEVEIRVSDNGPGIPKEILDKIFQPFFTTKPTGQGTGLGLSLSYDIIKAHGGELKVETKEGEGSKFIIHLPIQS